MLVVRSLAEAHVYARATGFAVTRRSAAGGVHLWEGWFRDQPREERFVERPSNGPSELLDAADFAEVAAELVRSCPSVGPLPRGETLRVIEDLTLALYAFEEAARDPDLADPEAATLTYELRSAWMRALPPAEPDIAAPEPLLEVQRARARATLLPGLAVAEGLRRLLQPGESAPVVSSDPWQLRALNLVEPAPRTAALLVFTEGGRITGHRIVEGADGRRLRG